MPITKSAIKKQRVDKKRAMTNEPVTGRVKATIKEVRQSPSKESVAALYQALDKAVAKKLVTLRTAARMKARVLKAIRAKLTKSPFGK